MSEEKKFSHGTIFAKKYTVEKYLKQGTIGEDIYIARNRESNRAVMIRLLPSEISKDQVLVQRFIRAFKLSVSLDHSNIMPAYETGLEYDKYFFITAYIEGNYLNEILVDNDICNIADTLKLGIVIANALDYAWLKAKIVHRNLKLDTILIDHDGFPIITDFGIAKTTTKKNLTLTGFTIGDPKYMSPEQVRGERDLDCRSDIYCLGLIIYKMLTGKLPFTGKSNVEIMEEQLSKSHESVKYLNRKVTAELSAVIDKMLAKNRNDRHSDWEILRQDFEAILDNKPPPSFEPQPKQQAKKDNGWIKKIFNW